MAAKECVTNVMSKWMVVAVMLLLSNAGHQSRAFHCPILECSCFYNGRETVKIACPPEHHGVRYTITHHVVEGELTVECLEPIAYRAAMFASFQFTNIVHINFVRCPLPAAADNISFAEIMQGVRPIILNFNGDQGASGSGAEDEGVVLEASMFANLSGLETLDLDRNGLVNIEMKRESAPEDWQTLESLSLADNRLTSVPKAMLRLVPALRGLSLAGNKLRFLADDDFENLTYLQMLKLDGSDLESVGPRVFRTLKALKLLRLNANRIRILPTQLLHGLTHLQFLDFSDNFLERIPAQFLKDAIHLKAVKIKRNRLVDLPEDLLWSATSLEEVHLSDNNLTAVPDLLFENTLRLARLQLKNNLLTSLPAGAFDNTTRLTALDLSNNRLSSLKAGTFDALIHLRELNLSHNALKTSTSEDGGPLFASLTDLVSLDLSHNLLDDVHPQTFDAMARLQFLDLSYNFLVFVDHVPPFRLPASLASLNMSHNMIGSLDLAWMDGVDNELTHFNVTFNQIKYVLVEDRPVGLAGQGFGAGSVVVDLRHNLVNTVDVVQMEQQLRDVEVVDVNRTNIVALGMILEAPRRPRNDNIRIMLADNPVACDCNLLSFVNHIKTTSEQNRSSSINSRVQFVDVGSLVCTTPHELLDRPIEGVSTEELYCAVTDDADCSDGCRCIRRALDGTATMDCRQRGLAAFPQRAPANTTVLHLEGNNVTSLASLALPAWANLTELYISDNSLADLTLPVSMPRNLKLIHLDNNRLKYLPEWFLIAVDSMDQSNETVLVLRLGNNPWVCDCRNVAFQRWLLDNGHRVSDHADVVCKMKKVERRVKTYVYGHLNRMILVECRSSNASDKTAVILAAVMSLFLTGALILGSKLMLRNFFKVKLFVLKLVIKRPRRKAIDSSTVDRQPTDA